MAHISQVSEALQNLKNELNICQYCTKLLCDNQIFITTQKYTIDKMYVKEIYFKKVSNRKYFNVI